MTVTSLLCGGIVWMAVVCAVAGIDADVGPGPAVSAASWAQLTAAELEAALRVAPNTRRAKNVLVFVGDGMGPNTVAAARIYQHGETGKQSFERFPHVGLIKTYCADRIVSESASTATALFTGAKVNAWTGGVDASVRPGDCAASRNPQTHLTSIMQWAQDAGKATGFVTTMRVTHATPMALYAHTADRNWECDANVPEKHRNTCKDIARQLIEDAPGRNLRVIMGGGRATMQANRSHSTDAWQCTRLDGRDLLATWTADKQRRGVSHALLSTNDDLRRLDAAHTDYVLGVFADAHMPFDHERDRSPDGQPSLANMTAAAIKVLQKHAEGFVLMVEGGLIDEAHHVGKARKALDEAAGFSDAIALAVELTRRDAQDTLIIVTADHAHGLTFGGFAPRGAGVLGIGGNRNNGETPYTTLNYAVGGANNYQYIVVAGNVSRRDPRVNRTDDFEYSQQTGILADEVVHGGADVHVFATGPHSHLFHTLHEQPYVARVIAYAAQIGPHAADARAAAPTSLAATLATVVFLSSLLQLYHIRHF